MLGIEGKVTSGWGRGFGEGIGEFEEELRGEEWNGRVRGAWSGPAGREGSSSPSKRGELGAMESDLGRGHSKALE